VSVSEQLTRLAHQGYPSSGESTGPHAVDGEPFGPAGDTALRDAVTASGAPFDDVVVPGEGHLFTDLATPDGDAAACDASIAAFDAFIR